MASASSSSETNDSDNDSIPTLVSAREPRVVLEQLDVTGLQPSECNPEVTSGDSRLDKASSPDSGTSDKELPSGSAESGGNDGEEQSALQPEKEKPRSSASQQGGALLCEVYDAEGNLLNSDDEEADANFNPESEPLSSTDSGESRAQAGGSANKESSGEGAPEDSGSSDLVLSDSEDVPQALREHLPRAAALKGRRPKRPRNRKVNWPLKVDSIQCPVDECDYVAHNRPDLMRKHLLKTHKLDKKDPRLECTKGMQRNEICRGCKKIFRNRSKHAKLCKYLREQDETLPSTSSGRRGGQRGGASSGVAGAGPVGQSDEGPDFDSVHSAVSVVDTFNRYCDFQGLARNTRQSYVRNVR